MSFKEWLFETGEFTNPYYAGQWKFLHILTLVICVALIFGFYFLVKFSKNKERDKKIIILSLTSLLIFFEVMIRIVYFVRRYHYNVPDMATCTALWIIIPKPWCDIACWGLIASVFVKKKFFYNYVAISALLSSVIFFVYPGVGFNNEVIMFSNLYSIVTHALLLVMSITLITLKFTEFKYKDFWKFAVCFLATYLYGLIEIFVLKKTDGQPFFADPMYFMPGGDIQQNILGISWPLYIVLYIIFIITYVNVFYLIVDKANVKKIFKKKK